MELFLGRQTAKQEQQKIKVILDEQDNGILLLETKEKDSPLKLIFSNKAVDSLYDIGLNDLTNEDFQALDPFQMKLFRKVDP